ncbi:MAG: family 1 encapsulin nanocompartment shell protein [Armatimonadota bacterium]|nr:family 1 encapsulin nanocompartment shell protein [Armatimonadota bacterium]
MPDYLMRDQAPLSEEQWQQIDQAVKAAAERVLVGRRIIPLFGPFGPGVQVVPIDVFTGVEQGVVDLLAEDEGGTVHAATREYRPLPVIYKDFSLNWRDLEASTQLGLPLDVSAAAAAAVSCARAEDELIFNGLTTGSTSYQGLLTAEGRNRMAMSESDYYRKQRIAIEEVAKALAAMEESASAAEVRGGGAGPGAGGP